MVASILVRSATRARAQRETQHSACHFKSRVKAHRAAAGALAAAAAPLSGFRAARPRRRRRHWPKRRRTMTLPPITPHTTTVQQGMPTFATHFRERLPGVHRKRNKLARRHLGAARLGIAKEHARDVKLSGRGRSSSRRRKSKEEGTRRNARHIRARWRLQADRGEQSSSFPWPHGRRARAATKIRSYESRSRRWRGRRSL